MIRQLVQYAFWAWCIVLSGCTICQNARRTVWHEPAAYSWKHDRRRSVEAYRQLAEQVWQEEAFYCPDLLAQPDYALGFRDGFVDYVYAGGTGEPPPVPPRHFWNVALRSPGGKERANQWFDGYRHGARVARDGGYRDLGVIHSSVFGLGAPPYADSPTSAIGLSFAEPHEVWAESDFDPHAEVLPEPEDAPRLSLPNEPARVPDQRPLPPPDALPSEAAIQQPPGDAPDENANAEEAPPDAPVEEPRSEEAANPAGTSQDAAAVRPAIATKQHNASPPESIKASVPAAAKNRRAREPATTVRFLVEPHQSSPMKGSRAHEPASLVPTSFVVKTPVPATTRSGSNAESESNAPPHRRIQSPTIRGKSTLTIQGNAGSWRSHQPSASNTGNPSFVQ